MRTDLGTNTVSRRRAARPQRPDHSNSRKLEVPTLAQQSLLYFLNPWRNYLLPARLVRALLHSSPSPLLAEMAQRPGGWRALEIVYRQDAPVDWLDRLALSANPLAQGLRNRRRVVTDRLAKLVALHAFQAPVTVLGLGTGPGRDIQTAMLESGIPQHQITAYLNDRDEAAVAEARALAERFGIASQVHGIPGDACRVRELLPDVTPQIVSLVGLAEFLTDSQLVGVLQAARDLLPPRGHLIMSGWQDPYGNQRCLARAWNWQPRRRSAQYLSLLLESVGLTIVEAVTEPTGIFPIVTAERPE